MTESDPISLHPDQLHGLLNAVVALAVVASLFCGVSFTIGSFAARGLIDWLWSVVLRRKVPPPDSGGHKDDDQQCAIAGVVDDDVPDRGKDRSDVFEQVKGRLVPSPVSKIEHPHAHQSSTA